jgi:GH15 family glucan-1,4-alpha-glucosidase
VVLKGLSNAPTGAIAAAATTSLPESPGGSRNWDYRYSWVRDSCFTVRTLAELGYAREADGFRRFIERSCAGNAGKLQILFGVGGERRLDEREIPELEGYRGAGPVRVGNAAERQVQLDVYGELLDLAWSWHQRGHAPDDDYWEFLVELVNDTVRKWRGPDQGIWEMRGEPRHFVLSKAMCWLAVDRGVRLAEDLRRPAPVEAWRAARGEIRAWLDEEGFDRSRGTFVQAQGLPVMDSSLLLLPIYGIVAADDDRMVRTVEAIRRDLDQDGLLRRYERDDLEGEEGVFLACTFWLAECLARQGNYADGEAVFRRAIATSNDLGLFAEEYDTRNREMLGNFPQGLTHLALIAAAVALGRAAK